MKWTVLMWKRTVGPVAERGLSHSVGMARKTFGVGFRLPLNLF